MLPSEIGKLSNMLLGTFRGNQLEGRLPSEVGLLTALTTVNFKFKPTSSLEISPRSLVV